ncbi:MAG: LytR C-terminal domain-containing protein, partial [Solirubrobacteraceae bacterium]
PASARTAPPRPAGARAGRPSPGRTPGEEFQFLREEERSPRRATALIAGGVVVGVVVLAVVLLAGGGSGSPTPGSTQASSASSGARSHRARHGSTVASPAETHVVVLNATEANGLAHRLSGNLQQNGYTLAAALSARPPSSRSTSVVEYASGHRTEALHVGRTLGITQTAPLEEALAPLVGGASVVVIAGADQAALAGSSSGASSNGTSPSSGTAAAGEAQGGGEAASGAAGTPAGGEAAAGTGQ